MQWLERLVCRVRGHDFYRHYDGPSSMYLRCLSCGMVTHGWRWSVRNTKATRVEVE